MSQIHISWGEGVATIPIRIQQVIVPGVHSFIRIGNGVGGKCKARGSKWHVLEYRSGGDPGLKGMCGYVRILGYKVCGGGGGVSPHPSLLSP